MWALLVFLMPRGASAIQPRLPPVRIEGNSTVYHVGDGMNNGKLGCVAEARRLLGHNNLGDNLPIVALRDPEAPACGTLVYIEHARTHRVALALRLDSGPWSCYAEDDARTTVVGPMCPPGSKRKSVADLTKRVANEIDHDGFDPVRIRWW